MLKDDKSYPFIKVTNERYPKLIITRKVLKDGALYFGPYPDARAANETKRILTACFHYANVVHRKNALVSTIIWDSASVLRSSHGSPRNTEKSLIKSNTFSTVAMLRSKRTKGKMGEAIESLNLNVLRNCAIKSKPSIPL